MGDESKTLKWIDEDTSSGIFTKFSSLSDIKNDNNIPSNWTISNKTT